MLSSDFDSDVLDRLADRLDDFRKDEPQNGSESDGSLLSKQTERDHFIERWLKIRTKTSRSPDFKLNRAQREYSRTCTNQNIVLKARQLGITTYIAARFFVQTISQRGTLSMQVTQDRESAEDIFRIVRRFWEKLPEEHRKGILRTSHCNARQLVFPERDSEYCLASADENAGRGRTIQNLHCSEVSRWGRRGDEALASLRAAVVPGGHIVLESTANGAGGVFYEEWQQSEETGYQRHFFPWWFDESYTLDPGPEFSPLTEDEAELVRLHGLTNGQIAWRRKQWASLRGLAAQEFAEDPVSCFKASGDCVFELDSVEQALQSASEPLILRDNQRLTIWMPPQEDKDYIIGVDPAGGGVDGDYSCAEVIDLETGLQCAELHGHFPPQELARRLADLGNEYGTALLAVERNNHGHAVLVDLHHLDYPRIYKQRGQYGWLTSGASRPRMIGNLSNILVDSPRLFRSPRLLNEFRAFVRDRNGNTGAASGAHDDCVIAMAIAWAVRAEEIGQSAKRRVQCAALARN